MSAAPRNADRHGEKEMTPSRSSAGRHFVEAPIYPKVLYAHRLGPSDFGAETEKKLKE